LSRPNIGIAQVSPAIHHSLLKNEKRSALQSLKSNRKSFRKK
jgi:hypothetical protein